LTRAPRFGRLRGARSAGQASERSAEPMNDGAFQAGIAASDCADDLARTDLHQRVVCSGARKPRLEADAGVTNHGSGQEYRVHQREILAPLSILRARSEVHRLLLHNAVSRSASVVGWPPRS
jgi:hypothetical protein